MMVGLIINLLLQINHKPVPDTDMFVKFTPKSDFKTIKDSAIDEI